LDGICFTPVKDSRLSPDSTLDLIAENPADAVNLQPNSSLTARVTLNDGRILDVPAAIEQPRPRLTLLSKNMQPAFAPSPIHISNATELPQDARLSFFLKTDFPATFPLSEKVEVATTDGSFSTMLTVSAGTLILQDANSTLALLDPLKAFGPAAFGPLQFRAIDREGAKGDWQPLATLVRIPSLREIRCPDSPEKDCVLHGSNLFLLESVSADPEFKKAVAVHAGFVDDSLTVPRPNGTLLYIKLRDDPATTATASLPVLPDPR
jgi:hypothetical protein